MIRITTPDLTAPDGSLIGVIAEDGATLDAPGIKKLRPGDDLPDRPGNFILDQTLSQYDAVSRALAIAKLVELRRAGATIILISHDEALLESCADEIWWICAAKLMGRGDAADILARYRHHVADAVRAAGANRLASIAPTMRSGDGRAKIGTIELLGEHGEPTTVWRSAEAVSIRLIVRFLAPVEDPVVGIMLRNRIGLSVYGTNTELERLRLGPVEAGDALRITYRFRCDLCPGEYTITVASHDPDGVWHDWMEDAVGISVTDTRYTAGVANLRAKVECEVLRGGEGFSPSGS